MSRGFFEGRALLWRSEVGAFFRGGPDLHGRGVLLSGDLTSAIEEEITPWEAQLPTPSLDLLDVDAGEDQAVLLGPNRRRTAYKLLNLEAEERQGGVVYRGTFRRPRRAQLDIEVFTDPEPLVLIMAALIVAACALDWKRMGGREECLKQFKDLANRCMSLGGSPDIRVRTTLGVSLRGGFRIGCHLDCDFVCRQ